MYKLIGANRMEYGPVGLDQLRQWYREGRVDAATLIQPDGAADWKPLRAIPELAAALGIAAGQPPPPIQPAAPPPMVGRPQPDGPNWLAITGLILGALSVVCCCHPTVAVLGLIFSCVALARGDGRPGGDRGIAIAGIILSTIGLLLHLLPFALPVVILNSLRNIHP